MSLVIPIPHCVEYITQVLVPLFSSCEIIYISDGPAHPYLSNYRGTNSFKLTDNNALHTLCALPTLALRGDDLVV